MMKDYLVKEMLKFEYGIERIKYIQPFEKWHILKLGLHDMNKEA